MNAVNLLPPKHRPRTPTGGQQGSAYAVIGVLGVICVMVLLYVLTTNGINSNQEAISKTQAETTQAKKRADSLAAYGNFIQIKEQRVASVKQLATGRLDWERLALGLAHVLPEKVWLISAEASATGQAGAGGAAPAAPAPPAPPAGGASGGSAPAAPAPSTPASKPTLQLIGCAARTPSVAIALVRLRHLPNVEDVELVSMEKPEENVGAAANGSGPAAPGGAPATAGGEACGPVKKKQSYKWEAKVIFKPQAGSTPTPEKKVPASLGGGA